jgi:hypothetical protein
MDEIPDLDDLNPINQIDSFHGNVVGLVQREDYFETLKVWCVPAFLDAYCYTALVSPDGKTCYIRKLLWRVFSHKPEKLFHTALEREIPLGVLDDLMSELGTISMNPFKTSMDKILDAARVGIHFHRGDASVEISWIGGFETSYAKLEKWRGAAIREFDRFFPEDQKS